MAAATRTAAFIATAPSPLELRLLAKAMATATAQIIAVTPETPRAPGKLINPSGGQPHELNATGGAAKGN
jgi:hypothetical protein